MSTAPTVSCDTRRARATPSTPRARRVRYRVVIVRTRGYQPTLDNVRRQTEQGTSKPEIIRCLKRYVAREIIPISAVPSPSRSL